MADLISRPFAALGHYLSNWFFPYQLHLEYRSGDRSSWQNLLLGISAFYFVSRLLWKDIFVTIKRSWAGIFFVFSLIALSPFLGWFPSPLEFASDRIAYFSSAFMALALAYLLDKAPLKIQWTILIIVFAVLTQLTRIQIPAWRTDRTLCEHSLKQDPLHYLSRINLALVYAREGDFFEAEKHLVIVTEKHPERYHGWLELAKVQAASERPTQALETLAEGLKKHPESQALRELQNSLIKI